MATVLQAMEALIDGKDGYVIDYKHGLENYNNSLKEIAKLINFNMEKYHISCSQISKYGNLSRNAISDYLKGKSTPNIVTVMVILRVVGLISQAQKMQQGKKPNMKRIFCQQANKKGE